MGIRTYKKALVDIAKTKQKLKKQAIRSNNKIRYEGSKQNINEARSKFENLFNEY